MRTETLLRLVELSAAFFEDERAALNHESLKDLALLCGDPAVAHPLIGADSDGRLSATWKRNGLPLSIEFKGGGALCWAATRKEGEFPRYGETTLTEMGDDIPAAFLERMYEA